MESSTEERCPNGCPSQHTEWYLATDTYECQRCGIEWTGVTEVARGDPEKKREETSAEIAAWVKNHLL